MEKAIYPNGKMAKNIMAEKCLADGYYSRMLS